MSTDWKALCAELLEALDGWHKAVFETGTGWVRPDETYLINRARAALAQPEPEVVGPTLQLPEQAPDEHPPSNLDRREVAAWYHGHACGWQAARAALAEEPVAAPAGPTDEELRQMFIAHSTVILPDEGDDVAPLGLDTEGASSFARAVLARWGRSVPTPVEGEVAELALKELERTMVLLMPVTGKNKIKRFDTIRAALKRLQELENKTDLIPAPPAPPPAEGEVASDDIPLGPFSEHDLQQQWNQQADEFNKWDSLDSCEQLEWAQARAIAAALARWGHHPAPPAEGEQRHPTPVPMAERLPGASHVYFEFVISDADDCTQAGGIAPTYAQALSEGQHYLAQYQQDGPHTLELRRVEVLPFTALPLPQGEVEK